MYQKQRKFILILFIVVFIALLVVMCLLLKDKDTYDISYTSSYWTIYDNCLDEIENNMNEITNANEHYDWWELKEVNDSDTDYIAMLNNLVSNIRTSYLILTDDGSSYTNSNPIRKYRDSNTISKDELSSLIVGMSSDDNNYLYNSLDKYHSYLISEDKTRESYFIEKIEHLENSLSFSYDDVTYDDLLSYELIYVQELSNLSSWLKGEYLKLK